MRRPAIDEPVTIVARISAIEVRALETWLDTYHVHPQRHLSMALLEHVPSSSR